MTGITHKQAGRYMRADLDGLLTAAQSRDLAAHLDECETCRLDSESLFSLTARLQSRFRARWDTQHGPSTSVMANIKSQSPRIIMQKRIYFTFNVLGGAATLLVLFFVVTSVISQFQKNSTPAANGTQTSAPVSTLQPEGLIAYVKDTNGNAEIYTMYADGSNQTNLTNHSAHDVNPIWSPDGRQIAFESDRVAFTQIYLMDADGSNLTKITDNKEADHVIGTQYGNMPNPWSPDGKKLIFSERVPGEDQWMLYVMDADGSNKIALTSEPGMYTFLGWSPDGNKIVYRTPNPGHSTESRIMITNVDGTSTIEGITGLDFGTANQIQWESLDSFVLHGYSSDSEPPAWQLSRMFVTTDTSVYNGFGPTIVNSNVPIVALFENTYVTEDQDALRWFAFNGNPIPMSPWYFPTGCETPESDRYLTDTYHSVSPDRKQAFVVILCGEGAQFHVENMDGTEIHQVGEALAKHLQVNAMEWSPDGKFVLTTIFNTNNESTELYRFDIEKMLKDPSSSQTQLTADGTMKYGATWQPIP